MDHSWVCWESEMESPSESEKNSDFQSLLSCDSSLDLDIRSWRNTEEVALGKLEESSQEADHEMELSEPLWEDDSKDSQKAETACEDDSFLQLFSEVTQMVERLYISSPKSSQTQQDYCGSGKQVDGEDVRCQEKTTGTAVSGAEESQLHILAEDEKEHFMGREDKTKENPEEQAIGEVYPQEMTHQDQDQDDSDSTSAAPVLDSTSPANMQEVQLSWDHSLQHLLFKRTLLSIWKIIASHRCSGPFLKAVSEKQAPGYSDVVKRPMDLTSIKKRLSKGHIQSMVQFQRDLMLMFQNAIMYNPFNHHVHRMAMEMQREVLEQLQMLCEVLLCSRDWLGLQAQADPSWREGGPEVHQQGREGDHGAGRRHAAYRCVLPHPHHVRGQEPALRVRPFQIGPGSCSRLEAPDLRDHDQAPRGVPGDIRRVLGGGGSPAAAALKSRGRAAPRGALAGVAPRTPARRDTAEGAGERRARQ